MGKLDNTPMNQEVIQDFLNVPGIVGVALIDGAAPPYFHGFDAGLDSSQQHTIAQSIQQVLETTPEGFNSFEFQFHLHRVYLHKLNQGITLLVITGIDLPSLTYTQAVRRLLLELQIGQNQQLVSEFRALATSSIVTLPIPATPSSYPLVPSGGSTFPEAIDPPKPLANPGGAVPSVPAEGEHTPSTPPELALPRTTDSPEFLERAAALPDLPSSSAQDGLQAASLQSVSLQSASLKDVLAAMNALSQLTSQYLGTLVVVNYWKTTRPTVDWLNHFQIERSAQITFSVQAPSERLPLLTREQHRQIQAWVAAFIERCSKVIRDFAKIVRQSLDEQQNALLFVPFDSPR